jgi:hypothetical protein
MGGGVNGGALSLFFAAATMGEACLGGHAMRWHPIGSLGCGGGSLTLLSVLPFVGSVRFAAF